MHGSTQAVRPAGRDILAWSHHSRRRPAPIHHINMVWWLSMVSVAGHRADRILPATDRSGDDTDEAHRIGRRHARNLADIFVATEWRVGATRIAAHHQLHRQEVG